MTKLSDPFCFSIPFKGNSLAIQARITPFPRSRSFFTADNSLILEIASLTAEPNKLATAAYKQTTDWLKAQARRELCENVERLKSLYGFNYRSLVIKDTRSRWGSCSSKGGLNFSWRLILAPENVLNYVVVHETAHLEQLNHSSAFWEIVRQRSPDFKACKKWLKDNGNRLMAWKPGHHQ